MQLQKNSDAYYSYYPLLYGYISISMYDIQHTLYNSTFSSFVIKT